MLQMQLLLTCANERIPGLYFKVWQPQPPTNSINLEQGKGVNLTKRQVFFRDRKNFPASGGCGRRHCTGLLLQ